MVGMKPISTDHKPSFSQLVAYSPIAFLPLPLSLPYGTGVAIYRISCYIINRWYSITLHYLEVTVTQSPSLAFDQQLYFYWDGLPPGTAVTMQDMLEVLGVQDPQRIRQTLTRIRKGEVRDPSSKGKLVPKPVRFDTRTRKYYDLSKVNPQMVASQVPGSILSTQISELLTRALTLSSSVGDDGLALSAEQYLQDDQIKELILQLPTEKMWQVHGTVLELAKARHLLALRAGPDQGQLPPQSGPTVATDTEE